MKSTLCASIVSLLKQYISAFSSTVGKAKTSGESGSTSWNGLNPACCMPNGRAPPLHRNPPRTPPDPPSKESSRLHAKSHRRFSHRQIASSPPRTAARQPTVALRLRLAVRQPDRDARFESLLAEAHNAQARSDFRGAAASYRQAVAIRPDIAELWSNLGLMQHQSGDYPRRRKRSGRHCVEPRAVRSQPVSRSRSYATNRPREATAYLLEAGKLNPKMRSRHWLGACVPRAVGARAVREMVSAGSRAGPSQWRGVVRPGARVFWYGGNGRSEAGGSFRGSAYDAGSRPACLLSRGV